MGTTFRVLSEARLVIGWSTRIREAGRASMEGERAVAKMEET